MSHLNKPRRVRRASPFHKRRSTFQPLAEPLERRLMLAAVVGVAPPANSHSAALSTDISATFDQTINGATATPQTFAVHSMQRGQVTSAAATVATSGTAVTLDPATDFFPGELVQVTVTAGINTTTSVGSGTGEEVEPHVWHLRTATSPSSGILTDSGQRLGDQEATDVQLGDLDGDGDLDAFVGGYRQNQVWLNNGSGEFSDSGQHLETGMYDRMQIQLGDLDGDGDLDAFAGSDRNADTVWLNDGSGRFSNSGQSLLGPTLENSTVGVHLGDVDGDGDLDVAISRGELLSPDSILINDGNGRFSDSGQELGIAYGSGFQESGGIALADVDGDGDLDAVTLNADIGNRIWRNDGIGRFTDSGLRLGDSSSFGIDFGDVDGDGDLDARLRNRIWLNDGNGQFADSGQAVGSAWLADIDGDGDLDASAAWRNDGNGVFTQIDQPSVSGRGALGDLDGDGDLDTFQVSRNSSGHQVFINDIVTVPSVTLSIDETSIPEPTGIATITATLSSTFGSPVTVELAASGTATLGTDYILSATQIVIEPGDLTGSPVTIKSNEDLLTTEGPETVVIDIAAVTNGTELGVQQVTTTIVDDENPATAPVVVSVEPAANSISASTSPKIRATLDQDINPGAATSATLSIHSAQRGKLLDADTTVDATGTIVTSSPAIDFFPGEVVQATVTSGIQSAAGESAKPYVWQFRAPTTGGTGQFTDSGQNIQSGGRIHETSLGDLDGDGDLDAVLIINDEGVVRVWINDGNAVFTDSGQAHGTGIIDIALGDLDGDGDLDAILAVSDDSNRLLLNDGGVFTDSGQDLGTHPSRAVAIGDLDGDGDLDALISIHSDEPEQIWLNDGGGVLANSGNTESFGHQVTLADLDGDGDLDAVGDGLWKNDRGQFTDSGQELPFGADFEDLDGDGDLDAFTSRGIWLNNGDGEFSDSGQQIQTGTSESLGFALSDLDGDGDLDAIVWPKTGPDEVWMNDGSGRFTYAGRAGTGNFGTGNSGDFNTRGITLGDLDGDGDLDLIVEQGVYGGVARNVWLHEDAAQDSFQVSALSLTSTGFVAEFNGEVDSSALNLYATQTFGPADATMIGETVGLVDGTLVVNNGGRAVTFTKSGGPLVPDTYTVVLRTGSDAFRDVGGRSLDGNADGTAGDEYSDTLLLVAAAAEPITIGLPDFVRGPGQQVNLPADDTLGIPVTISEGDNVKAIDLSLSYDPALLEITGATVGSEMPPGASVNVNTSTPGELIVAFSSATALPAGSNEIVHLQARVPGTDPEDIYGEQQILDVHSVTISDGNDNEFPVMADDAVHLVSYLADVSGNQRINASDAAQVARVAALLDDGFSATPLTDPGIVGDISGNGRVNAADASLIARFAALISVPEIPALPSAAAAADGDLAIAAKPNNGQGGKKGGGKSPAGSVSVSPRQSLHTSELGGTAEFEVVLGLLPTANVTFDISTSDLSEGILSTEAQGSTPAQGPGEVVTLTFTPADWDTPQVVTVTGVNDANQDGSINYQALTAAAVSDDSNYDTLDPPDVNLITNLDDESPAIFVNEFYFDYEQGPRGRKTGYRGELTVQVLAASDNSAAAGAGVALSVYVSNDTDVNNDSNVKNFVGETNSEGVFAARWWPGPGSYIVEVTDVWLSGHAWNPVGNLETKFTDQDDDHHPELELELQGSQLTAANTRVIVIHGQEDAAQAASDGLPAAFLVGGSDLESTALISGHTSAAAVFSAYPPLFAHRVQRGLLVHSSLQERQTDSGLSDAWREQNLISDDEAGVLQAAWASPLPRGGYRANVDACFSGHFWDPDGGLEIGLEDEGG